MSLPHLTEFETRTFYRQILMNLREQRIQYQSIFTNILLFIIFVTLIGTWLWWKRKNRLTDEEKQKQEKELQNYIFKKINSKNNQLNQVSSSSNLITNLPSYENELLQPSMTTI
jgi:large-conductance mechanosensitive channel